MFRRHTQSVFFIYNIINLYVVMIEDTALQEKEETAAESLCRRRRSSSSSSSSGSGDDVEPRDEVVGWSSYDDDVEQRLLWETKVRSHHWSLID